MLNKNNKILFTLKSFLFKYLHKDLNKLLLFTYKINMLFYKYTTIFMPVKIKKFSVVRSPTMSKLSKEQFEIREYKAVIIFNTINKLSFIIMEPFLLSINLNHSYFSIKTNYV